MRARAIEKRAFGTRDRRLSSNLYLVRLIPYLYQLSTVKFYDILSEAYNKIMKVGFAKFLASLVYDTSGRPRTKKVN